MNGWATVNARRLAQHGLTTPFAAGTAPAVVGAAVSGVHAQVLSAAEVSAAMRIDGATRSDVRRALWEDRTLVKTFGPRGTVHLLPAADLGRWMSAMGPVPWRSPFPDDVRMTDAQTHTVIGAIWHLKRAGRKVVVTVEPLGRLSKARLADVDAQVIRLGEIVEAEATLTIGEVTVGPHA